MLNDLLLWNKIGRIIVLLAERIGVSPDRALDVFYSSRTCELLHDPETRLYLLGDRYIVEDVIREMQALS